MGTKKTLCALLAVFLFVNSYADDITKIYHFSNPAGKLMGNLIIKGPHPKTIQYVSLDTGKENISSDHASFLSPHENKNIPTKKSIVNEIEIYPNPARITIFINTLHGQLQKTQITIISQSGKIIHSQAINSSNTSVEINISDFPSGAYTLIYKKNDIFFRKKFTKIN